MASSKNRKAAALALAVVGVAGLSIASAAQLNIGTASLGAGQEIVQACQDDEIAVSFSNEFASSTVGYKVTSVDLGDLTGCQGDLNYAVTLTGANGAALAELEGTGLGTTGSKSIAVPVGTTVAASAVEGVSVVIFS